MPTYKDAERRDALQTRMHEPTQSVGNAPERLGGREAANREKDSEQRRARPDAERKDSTERPRAKVNSNVGDSGFADLLQDDAGSTGSAGRSRK